MLKPTVLILALATLAHASRIAPGEYILQITATDYSTNESGPEPYADWFTGGEVPFLIDVAIPQHYIVSFDLIACPEATPCLLTNTAAPGAPAQSTPEPATWLLAAFALAWLAVRNTDAASAFRGIDPRMARVEVGAGDAAMPLDDHDAGIRETL